MVFDSPFIEGIKKRMEGPFFKKQKTIEDKKADLPIFLLAS